MFLWPNDFGTLTSIIHIFNIHIHLTLVNKRKCCHCSHWPIALTHKQFNKTKTIKKSILKVRNSLKFLLLIFIIVFKTITNSLNRNRKAENIFTQLLQLLLKGNVSVSVVLFTSLTFMFQQSENTKRISLSSFSI